MTAGHRGGRRGLCRTAFGSNDVLRREVPSVQSVGGACLRILRHFVVRLRLRRRFWGRFNFAKRMQWQAVLALLQPASSDLVCDIGCGTGTFTHLMARRVFEVHGIDIAISSLGLAIGAERPENCFLECADAEHLPFRESAFDKAFSICTFEHIEDDLQALREVVRVLKPEGTVVLTLDSFSYPHGISGSARERLFKKRNIRRLYRLSEAVHWVEHCGLTFEEGYYLVRSPMSDWFYRLGVRVGYARSLLFVLLFPILYPLAAASDRLLGSQEGGYILVIAAKKPGYTPMLNGECSPPCRPQEAG